MESENRFSLEKFDPEVLREYDIRGIVDQNLTENTAYTIGRTFGQIVCKKFSNKKISFFILPGRHERTVTGPAGWAAEGDLGLAMASQRQNSRNLLASGPFRSNFFLEFI